MKRSLRSSLKNSVVGPLSKRNMPRSREFRTNDRRTRVSKDRVDLEASQAARVPDVQSRIGVESRKSSEKSQDCQHWPEDEQVKSLGVIKAETGREREEMLSAELR